MTQPPFPGNFDALARQYWNTWNEMLGRGSAGNGWSLPGGFPGGLPGGMNNPFAASLAAMNGGLPPGLAGFDPGAYEWYQRMQRLAADFSEGGAHAAEVAAAWREMMGGEGGKSVAQMLRSMHGGLAGAGWLEQVKPMVESLLRPLRDRNAEWLHRPTFGPMREHQERLQALALAWQEWDRHNEAFNQLLARVGQDAFARFEVMLQECNAPGKRLESARALFDLWIEAAEEAWAELAYTEEYRKSYGEMTNALMRLRLALQGEVERFAAQLGMPGRTEVDALARKVAELERAQYLARRQARATEGKGAASTNPHATTGATVRRPAAAKAAPRPAAAKPAPAAAPAKAVATRPARKPAKKKPASRAAKPARTTPVAKAAPGRAITRAPASRTPVKKAAGGGSRAQAPVAPARKPATAPAATKVVSMKDWVSRNLPGITPPVAPERRGKSGRK